MPRARPRAIQCWENREGAAGLTAAGLPGGPIGFGGGCCGGAAHCMCDGAAGGAVSGTAGGAAGGAGGAAGGAAGSATASRRWCREAGARAPLPFFVFGFVGVGGSTTGSVFAGESRGFLPPTKVGARRLSSASISNATLVGGADGIGSGGAGAGSGAGARLLAGGSGVGSGSGMGSGSGAG